MHGTKTRPLTVSPDHPGTRYPLRAACLQLVGAHPPGVTLPGVVKLALSYEMRVPDFGPPGEALYGAALDQSEWADRLGFDSVTLSEHHASPDGYMPSPIVMASAIGARTRRLRIMISLVLLPFYHPLRLAGTRRCATWFAGAAST